MRQKKTCPLCMTKLKEKDGNLICPECGYRICDQDYASHGHYTNPSHDHYSENLSHSHDEKQSYTSGPQSYTSKQSYTGQTVYSANKASHSASQATTEDYEMPRPPKPKNILKWVVIIYLIMAVGYFADAFFGFTFSMFR